MDAQPPDAGGDLPPAQPDAALPSPPGADAPVAPRTPTEGPTVPGGEATPLPAPQAGGRAKAPDRSRRRLVPARDALEVVARLALGAAALLPLLWLLRRGPLVAPITLFSAADSTNGFFAAANILPLLALAGGLAGVWALLSRRAESPGWAGAAALSLPLLALWAAAAHAAYAQDAAYNLQIALAMALLYVAFVAALGTQAVPCGLLALAAIGADLGLRGLRQFTAGQPTPVAWTGPAFAAAIPVRVAATLHNPNVLAAVLLLCMGGAAALAIGVRPWPLRLLGLLALLPMAAALPLTFSRAAYLGLALACAGVLVAVPAAHRLRAALAVACIALPIAVVAYKVPGVAFRVHGISVQRGGDVSSRFFTWTDAFSVWRSHPLWGAGPGGLEVFYAAHEPLGAGGTYGLIDIPGSADNDPLEWLAETGLVGAAALAGGAGVLALAVRRGATRRGPDAQAQSVALTAFVVGTVLQGGLEVTAFVLPVEGVLALALAALTGAAGLSRPIRPAGIGRLLGAATATAAVAVALTLHTPWQAQQVFQRGWALLQAGHPAAAQPLLGAAAAAAPGVERDAAAAGDAAVQVAYAAGPRPPAAVVATARGDLGGALRLDPWDGDTWAALGALETHIGARTAAACAMQAALRSFPYSAYFASQLAGDLRAVGQVTAARADAGYAARLFPLDLAVYREHGDQHAPYYAAAVRLQRTDQAAWGPEPLPTRPDLPLTTPTCLRSLAAAGLPAWTFARAMRGA